MMTTTLGINLKTARGRREMTSEQLAELAGVTAETIRLIENGQTENPQATTLVRLADALQITVHELVREPASPASPSRAQAENDRASHDSVTTQPNHPGRHDAAGLDVDASMRSESKGTTRRKASTGH